VKGWDSEPSSSDAGRGVVTPAREAPLHAGRADDRPIAVVGACGLLGAYLYRSFGDDGPVVGTGFEHGVDRFEPLDLRDHYAVSRFLARHQPRAVVCAAAVSNVERCELHPRSTREVNVDGTLGLARAAAEVGAAFVFLSSEYVFDGRGESYDEAAPVNPLNEYGRQKVEVEQALPDVTEGDWMVARVSCLYGHERRAKNFVYQLWAALTEGRPFPAPNDQIGTPTAVANAAEVIRELVDRGCRGTFHVAGPDRMLRSDFALVAARRLGLDAELVQPTPTGDLGLVARRPRRAGLLTDRVSSICETPLMPVEEGIDAMLAERPVRAPMHVS
jgi:dTDP-4-dehydrorhamnose reductase